MAEKLQINIENMQSHGLSETQILSVGVGDEGVKGVIRERQYS